MNSRGPKSPALAMHCMHSVICFCMPCASWIDSFGFTPIVKALKKNRRGKLKEMTYLSGVVPDTTSESTCIWMGAMVATY